MSQLLLRFRRTAFALAFAVLALAPTPSAALTLEASLYPDAPRIPYEGRTFTFVRGGLYEVQGSLFVFLQQFYDPDYYGKSYRTVNGQVYRIIDSATAEPTLRSLGNGFESAATIRDLVGPGRGFTSITLQSPRAPTVADYVALRRRILVEGGTFLDNRIEPSAAVVRSGTRSLRAYAVPPGGGTSLSKASLESEVMHFALGDNVWFSGWFYIAQGVPLGLLDIESSFVVQYPGLRLLLDDSLQPRVELKWGAKPTYFAAAGSNLPMRQWVHVRLHVLLSDDVDGRVELWLDGRQVINATGQTLPLADTLYDRMEVGITANEGATAEVFVDSLSIGHDPV